MLNDETSDILNELWTRMYSDEGTLFGHVGLAPWWVLDADYRASLLRPN